MLQFIRYVTPFRRTAPSTSTRASPITACGTIPLSTTGRQKLVFKVVQPAIFLMDLIESPFIEFLLALGVYLLGNLTNLVGHELIYRLHERSRLGPPSSMLYIGRLESREFEGSVHVLGTGRVGGKEIGNGPGPDHLVPCAIRDLPTRLQILVRGGHVFS